LARDHGFDMEGEIFDYVVVGSGSAGSVLASRHPAANWLYSSEPSGNTNSPSIMSGDKAFRMILAAAA
jgi:hypothetical protein